MVQFPDHVKTNIHVPKIFAMTHILIDPKIRISNTVSIMHGSCMQHLKICPIFSNSPPQNLDQETWLCRTHMVEKEIKTPNPTIRE